MAQDEMWHFHAGDPIEHIQLTADGARVVRLGAGVLAGDAPQLLVPRGTWQGARLAPGGRRGFALVGCTVTPPWDERGFELGERSQLVSAFPSAQAWIATLTR
jgi:predicted cupin superfamily sugar epimerase